MKTEILDSSIFMNGEFKSKENILKRLSLGDFKRFYEMENESIVVEHSDNVQLSIRLTVDRIIIRTKFPQLGNLVQIIVTVSILFIELF